MQNDNLAALCLFFFLSLSLSSSLLHFLEFQEQLKPSVSLGCPLLQDYSLLNLLAAFAIILSLLCVPPQAVRRPRRRRDRLRKKRDRRARVRARQAQRHIRLLEEKESKREREMTT